ncbi:MAG: DEAD/DEAH box helicase, partial [Acidimicrobiales bacterium]
MGLAAAAAVEQVAQGRMVPQLKQRRASRRQNKGESPNFRVRWIPTLLEANRVNALVASVPGTVMTSNPRQDKHSFVTSLIAELVDAIARIAAERIDSPAAPPEPNSLHDAGEALLANLDGSSFQLPSQPGNDLSRRLARWAQHVVGVGGDRLIVQLDPPDEIGAWHAKVLAPTEDGDVEPVEAALVTSSKSRAKALGDQLSRIERLFPELLRPGGHRRGEVILDQDEAWRLMTDGGESLTASGFEVRVPALSRKKPTPTLRLTSEGDETMVGAQQLANVRWSAVFGDVELTAEEISQLARQARPLVKSRGKWVELDKVDLAEAAAALAERADQTRLSGADMLRHALGLEGGGLLGGINLSGGGWASDLFRSVEDLPEEPPTKPPHFEGELRTYQADALAWLGLLDATGLGGILALDMGLGKTPTMLANIAASTSFGPALVVAPPAVVGNWANEAQRFVPGVTVLVHHGPNRARGEELADLADEYDLIITTYGTAVRDIEEFSHIEFGKVVLDEAQAIKNPTSETAQQLRRLDARTRVALTGTPIENGLGDLWAILDWTNPGLVGARAPFIANMTPESKGKEGAEQALRALNGLLVFRRTKAEPAIAAELPDRIDELDQCAMTPEQIGLYQAVLDDLTAATAAADTGSSERKGAVLAAITALKQICNHPVNYEADDEPLDGRSGKLARLNEIVETVFAADERMLIFTHFATWGNRMADYLTERTGKSIRCYHGGLSRGERDRMVEEFQAGTGAGALVLSLKAGGTGLNLTAASHVVLYDRWWNPAVEDQARDRVWRIGQKNTVICHRLICPGTIDERVEEVVAGKRQIADMVLPKSSSIGDLDAEQLQRVLGLDSEAMLELEPGEADMEVAQ